MRDDSSSRPEELKGLQNEPLMELEDAAVSCVRVDAQRRIREASSQVVGIAGRHHAVVITVGHQDGLLNAR